MLIKELSTPIKPFAKKIIKGKNKMNWWQKLKAHFSYERMITSEERYWHAGRDEGRKESQHQSYLQGYNDGQKEGWERGYKAGISRGDSLLRK